LSAQQKTREKRRKPVMNVLNFYYIKSAKDDMVYPAHYLVLELNKDGIIYSGKAVIEDNEGKNIFSSTHFEVIKSMVAQVNMLVKQELK